MSRYNLGYKTLNQDIWKQVIDNCNKETAFLMPQTGIFDIAYGFDHACGYFIQLFDTTQSDDEIEECVNIDSLFNGFTGAELGFILRLLECTNQEHIDNAFLDLPF